MCDLATYIQWVAFANVAQGPLVRAILNVGVKWKLVHPWVPSWGNFIFGCRGIPIYPKGTSEIGGSLLYSEGGGSIEGFGGWAEKASGGTHFIAFVVILNFHLMVSRYSNSPPLGPVLCETAKLEKFPRTLRHAVQMRGWRVGLKRRPPEITFAR